MYKQEEHFSFCKEIYYLGKIFLRLHTWEVKHNSM